MNIRVEENDFGAALIVCETEEEIGQRCAELIVAEVRRKPSLLLCAATNGQPTHAYRLLDISEDRYFSFSNAPADPQKECEQIGGILREHGFDTEIASPNFGIWNGVVTNPRNIQVAARLTFE